MKKLLGILMTTVLILGLMTAGVLATPAQKLSNRQIQQFEQLGYSDEEIANLSDVEVNRISGKHGKLVSYVTKYYRVNSSGQMTELTKESALKEVKDDKDKKTQAASDLSPMSSGSGSSSNSWLSMTTTVSDLGNKDFYFKNSFTWLSNPWVHLTDVIGMTHNSSISVISGSEYLKVSYNKYSDTLSGVQDDYYWTANIKDIPGYAFSYGLRSSDGLWTYMDPHGYMIYEGLATPSYFVGSSNAYGHYTHETIIAKLGISLSTGSMSVSPTVAVSKAPDTDAYFYIN